MIKHRITIVAIALLLLALLLLFDRFVYKLPNKLYVLLMVAICAIMIIGMIIIRKQG